MIGVFCKNNRASRIAIHSSKIQISTAAQIKKTGNSKRVKEKENRLRNHQRRKSNLSVTSTTNVTIIKCSEYFFSLSAASTCNDATEPRDAQCIENLSLQLKNFPIALFRVYAHDHIIIANVCGEKRAKHYKLHN